MNALRYVFVTCVVGSLWSSTSTAQQPSLSGVYTREGAALAVLEGDEQTLIQYESTFPQGQSTGACECTFSVRQKKSPGTWVLASVQPERIWTLNLESGRLRLKGPGAGCCGAGWKGQDSFSRPSTQALTVCKAKGTRVRLQPLEGAAGSGPSVAAGEEVQVFASVPPPDLVPARVVQGGAALVGLMRYSDLACPEQGREAGADVKWLAGRWIQVRTEGKGYVIEKYCDSATPSVLLKADGALVVDFGQESVEGTVTAVKPGAAGASSLEVAYEGGTHETLEWTVVDAKRNVVRLKGGTDYFRQGELYVRDNARKGIPVRAEACDESE
ncbi:hypothetical protein [Myxococcus landrumensis]|uniref:Lipoprotein n=1 Tax=Myxococcus landrumensis TaxID=2813577 RepID=A0ABX7NCA3_9BACT|nr:hypothetical protein [Myxococcus landrumus]QSQ16422.1 hypothetical protein JY572_10390 [Myxococcus landrumus]